VETGVAVSNASNVSNVSNASSVSVRRGVPVVSWSVIWGSLR